ncbi:MAG: transposase [Candidatus Humimicrobiaceae bacterium]
MENVKVSRNRIVFYKSSLFKKDKRKEVMLIDLVKDTFLSGLSARKGGEVPESILGYKISEATVSNIARSLDVRL